MVQKLFTTQPNFSNALGLSPKHILEKDDGASEIKPLISRSKEGVAQYCLRYVVPKHACIKSIDGKDYEFPTSAILRFLVIAFSNIAPYRLSGHPGGMLPIIHKPRTS